MRRAIRAYLLPVLSGLLLAASFPPAGFWALAWVALVPLYAALYDAPDAKEAANRGGLAGLAFYVVSLGWMTKIFGPMAAAFWCVFALAVAAHAALMLPLIRRWRSASTAWVAGSIVLAGALWAGVEYFRSEIWWLDCAWLALGYSQARCLPLFQACSVVGLYGLSAVIVAVNAALAAAAAGRRAPAAAAVCAVAALAAWGGRRAARVSPGDGRPARVALVQDESYDVGKLAKLSLGPGARDAELLVWPEYSFTVPAGHEQVYRAYLAGRLRGSKAVAVLGGAIFPDDMKKGREQNFAWVLSPGGELLGRYDKLHPIPYVEKLLPPNPAPRAVRTPLGLLGVQICYDLDFQDGSRLMAKQGARLLVVPNIDPYEWGPAQHAQHSSMSAARAVETGLWIARAASSGFSQIVDPSGRVVAARGYGRTGALVGEVRLRGADTLYLRGGWLTGPACLLVTALLLLRLALAWAAGRGLAPKVLGAS